MKPFTLSREELRIKFEQLEVVKEVHCKEPSERIQIIMDILAMQEDIDDKCEVTLDNMNLVTINLHCLDVEWVNLLIRELAKG